MTTNTRGNQNGPFGQSGSLEYRTISTPTYEISEQDAGLELRVTAACVITLPRAADSPQSGFFCSVVRMGAGAVSFAAGPGATVLSSAGATPSITSTYTGCTCGVEANGDWLLLGALA